MTATTLLEDKLRELALFEPGPLPVLSLYLNTQSDGHGRDNFEPFIRKELKTKAATYPLRSPERESFERDSEKIAAWLQTELRASSNSAAIFACAGAGEFFEALQMDAPVDTHQFFVDRQPHLYTLARLNDQYPAYAAVIANTNTARIFVFGLARTLETDTVSNTKVGKTQVGGWSQARYQRHVQNYHLHHSKEVLDHLDKIVREEGIQHIIFAGDEVILPVLRDQLSPFLAEKVVDELSLDITTPEDAIMKATLAAMRDHDARSDGEEVSAMIDAYRSGGLAAAGIHDVLAGLANGQVDTLFVSTSPEQLHADGEGVDEVLAPVLAELPAGTDTGGEIADALVTRAHQTGARVRFIEDASLLAPIGGVGATLRYRV